MIERACDQLINWCILYRGFDPAKKEIYIYGADLLLSSLLATGLLLFVAMLLGHMRDALIYLLITMPLRTYGGGWHAPKHYQCILIQIISFLIIIGLTAAIPSGAWQAISFLFMLAMPAIVFTRVPSEHPENPLTPEAKASMKRICAALCLCIAIAVFVLFTAGHARLGFHITVSAMAAGISFLIPNRKKGGEDNEKTDFCKTS